MNYRNWAGIHLKPVMPEWCPYTEPVAVEVAAFPPDRYRRDLDNILKLTLDAIESAGVIQNDYLVYDLRIIRKEVVRDGRLDVCVEPL